MNYIFFLLLLLLTAILLQRDSVFAVIYLFVGALVLGRWWNERVLKSLSLAREWTPRAFIGEESKVRLHIHNTSFLPLGWLHVYESIPPQLAAPNSVNRIISLGSNGSVVLDYTLHALKRGYYKLGPLSMSTGDLFGLNPDGCRRIDEEYFTVFPRIISFNWLNLPSRSPLGTLRYNQPLFEDPARVLNKRDYVSGDSLRSVDWKASAALGRLQVKQFEPSIALQTSIFLNLNSLEYPPSARLDASELGIVIAASLANWVISQKQTVGLVTNGEDMLNPDSTVVTLPIRKGQGHLLRILELLARIQVRDAISLEDVLQREAPDLPWGTTIIAITGNIEDTLFDALFQARRYGLNILLIIVGRIPNARSVQKRAEYFGISVYIFQSEHDLDVWRS